MELGLPEGIDLIDHFDSLEIVRRWFSFKTIPLTLFVLFWDGFLIFWYTQAIRASNTMMLVFPLIHVVIGAGLTYYVLASYINRTYIRVDQSYISITHAPLPAFGNKTVSASDVKQVYSKERVSRSRRGTSVTYEVHALTHSGRNTKLLGGLLNSEQALFIEQEIEKFLRIKDVPVRGEISR